MLIVHHLGISQSDRIVWLCEELDLPYEMVKYDRAPTGGGPAAYKALFPYGTAPVIQDGDRWLGESGAIVEYIIHRHAGGRLAVAPDQPNYADYLYWSHFANASFMAGGMWELGLILQEIGPEERVRRPGRSRWEKAFDVVEQRLGEAPFFAGDAFTAADIMMHFPLTHMRRFVPFDLSGSPKTLAYLQRIGERPAYRRAMAKADPGVEPFLS